MKTYNITINVSIEENEVEEVLPKSISEPSILNNSMDSAIDVCIGQAYNSTITKIDERDWYKFGVLPNHRYYIIVWADNTFGTNLSGLKDTQLRVYLNKANNKIAALNNTDAPIEMNLGYGSSVIIETIPNNYLPSKMSHCIAPSTVKFFIEQQDLNPQTGTYSFQIFKDDMPKCLDGTYNYNTPMSNSLFFGAISPPSSTIPI